MPRQRHNAKCGIDDLDNMNFERYKSIMAEITKTNK